MDTTGSSRALQTELLRARGGRNKIAPECATRGNFTLATLSDVGAMRWPHCIALHDATGSLTFLELHRAARHFAHRLIALGVGEGDRVAILGTKDTQTVVAILGAAKAGAVYVPLDPSLPEARLKFMLDDADPRVVVGQARLYPLAGGRMFIETAHCTHPHPRLRDNSANTPLPRVSPESVAYMMYTSGSTGYPKGVQIEHRSVEAFFLAHNAGAEIQAGDRCMNTGPFHFDVSIMDVFLPLYFGASVVLTPEVPMPKLLLRTIEQHRITHFYAVGTILALMTGDGRWLDQYDLSSLRVLQTGAEVCNPRVVNEWLARLPDLVFLNSYGPTEVTVGCLYYRKAEPGLLATDHDVPIGCLHPGSSALLLNADGTRVTTPGTHGELCLSGAQLMRGYWKRQREEEAAFTTIEGERYYRTGDIVFADAEGLLHYVGRRDHEVKIDGCRIHLNEVKRCLEAHPLVASASAFVVMNRQHRPRVAAAIVPRGELDANGANELLANLARELPQPALPLALLICADLPRTPTGKTDTRVCADVLQRALTHYVARTFVLTNADATPLEPSPNNTSRPYPCPADKPVCLQ